MRTLSNLKMLPLLVLAGRFNAPEGDEGGAGGDAKGKAEDKSSEKPADKSKEKADEKGDEDKPAIPYARFTEVNQQRRDAEAKVTTLTADNERLTRENTQLKSADQAGALAAAQDRVKELEKSIGEVEKEFEDMLEVALAPLPKEKAAIVRDIPGGARIQFAWFNKHRSSLVGEDSPKGPPGVKGPKHEKKPGAKDEPVASSVAQSFVEQAKPAEKTGFKGLL